MAKDRFLGLYEMGYRVTTNNKRPIYKPEDYEGLNLRVDQHELSIDILKCLGA